MLGNLILTVNTVFPLFAVMAAGFLLRKPLKMDDAFLNRNNRLCFSVFLPLHLFSNVYHSRFDLRSGSSLILFCVFGILFLFLLSCLAAFAIVKDPAKRGTLAQGMFRSNYVILGLPMIANLCGADSTDIASVMLAVAVPVFNILSVVALELFCGKSRSFAAILKNIAKNPLVLAVLIALAIRALSIRLPDAVMSAIGYLSSIATGFMLFIMGASLHPSAVRDNRKYLAAAVFFKLVLSPALMLGIAYLLGFRGPAFATILIIFATPTALASFTMAQQMGGDADLANEIVVFTTALSLISLFAWIFLFLQLGAY